jgi:hypothetical protein
MKKQKPIDLDNLIKQANLVKKLQEGVDLIRSISPEIPGTKSPTIGSIAKDLKIDRNQLKRYSFT